MILLNDVIEILARPDLHRIRSAEVELPTHPHAPQCAMAWFMTIQCNAVWFAVMLQSFAEKCFRRSNASRSAEEELYGIALTINASITDTSIRRAL